MRRTCRPVRRQVKEGPRRADPTCVEHPRADLLTAQPGDRCPACSAALRPGAPWCTLCYADLRPPAPEPVVVLPESAPSEQPPGELPAAKPAGSAGAHVADPGGLADLLAHPLAAPDPAPVSLGRHAAADSGGGARAAHLEARWPCSGCGVDNPMSESACAAGGSGFLAGLRDEEPPLLDIPGVGDLTRLSRAQRMGFAASVVLVVVLLTMLLALITR